MRDRGYYNNLPMLSEYELLNIVSPKRYTRLSQETQWNSKNVVCFFVLYQNRDRFMLLMKKEQENETFLGQPTFGTYSIYFCDFLPCALL